MSQFEDVLVYLNSVKEYLQDEPVFQYNLSLARAAAGQYEEAIAGFQKLHSQKDADPILAMWLARCYICTDKARAAWDLYLRMEGSGEAFALLQLIANECYHHGQFLVAARAFQALTRLDPHTDYWEATRGACAGVFQLVVAGKEPPSALRDAVTILQGQLARNPQVEYMIKVLAKWARDNGIAGIQ